ncbi:hypothetical protein IMCC3317_16320 [Kordia antarctica]|uniref:Tissue inhibitor of metalloproteinase n=1 Tax=Kordia antarctica TaxID=1218801 RepID=A0A7L4ZI08_9FLAO|nr:hypothetical protein [Kordia antarctica]QHI36272.1 hypothetical protein IMCC3317_16320 [Kordia antarctica]
MKKIIQIIAMLCVVHVSACTCDPPSITEKYINSDFVANVTLVKIYPNEKDQELYKADIKTNTLYKGEKITSIYVVGNNGGIGSSCSIFIEKNTTLIAYASRTKDGKYTIGMCSGLLYIDYSGIYRKKRRKTARAMKQQRRELAILDLFKKKKINHTNKIHYREKGKLHKQLVQFKGIKLKKTYAFFELTFTSDVKVKLVKMIDSFNNPVDDKLVEILKTSSWSSFDNGIQDKIPENSTLMIGIYFYESEGKYESFISQYYL